MQCTHYQVYFCSVRKIVWLHVHYSYCTICVLLFVCVCELQRGYSISILWDNNMLAQAQKSYPNPAPWPPKLILQHNLDAVTFDTTRYTEHTARPSNSLRQSTSLPVMSRPEILSSSRFGPKSVCLLVSVFPDWFWDNMIPPGTRNGSTIPPFCRSCHGLRICCHHASARKSIVSSCLCLSWLISGQQDKSERVYGKYWSRITGIFKLRSSVPHEYFPHYVYKRFLYI